MLRAEADRVPSCNFLTTGLHICEGLRNKSGEPIHASIGSNSEWACIEVVVGEVSVIKGILTL